MIQGSWKWRIAAAALVCVLAQVGIAVAQENVYSHTWAWTPPTTGTAVEYYVVEISEDSGPWYSPPNPATRTTSFTADLEFYHTYSIRVYGVDINDVRGPYSVPSLPQIEPEGLPAPIPPGKPAGGFVK